MKLKDFKKACNDLLSETFDGTYPVYGSETKDGYQRPSFFTELLPRTWRRLNRNMTEAGLTYKLTLLETTHDEAKCLDIVSAVIDAFGFTIKAAGRVFLVEDIDYNFIDSNNDVLQITIDFANVRLVTTETVTADMMEKILMDLEIYSTDGQLMVRDSMSIEGDKE